MCWGSVKGPPGVFWHCGDFFVSSGVLALGIDLVARGYRLQESVAHC